MLKRLRELLGSRKNDRPLSEDDGPSDPSPSPAPPAIHRLPAVVHSPIDDVDLDPDAVRIVRRLTRFDHTAYLVGGCVRDLLLGRKPKDFDVGTSATPRQVKRLFSNCRIIGRRFRLAHIYFQSGKIIEVATFRARDLQDDAEEARADDVLIRDDNIFGTPEEDAVRRDFTINALFYDVNAGTVLDHADGLEDIRRRVVRTIGDPDVRFREDPIRILRAIKFAARLDFELEDRTLDSLKRLRGEIGKAAPPRILEEINRYCRGGAARASFDLAFETGVFEAILPEFEEPYRSQEARGLLRALLDAVDRRNGTSPPISTGEIFTCLLVPIVAPTLGWGFDGSAAGRREADVRNAVDLRLRPVALRLRMSRRDQERCRQAIAVLHRMVPARHVKRSLRNALIRRPSFADASWMLEAVASSLGGAFADAFAWWSASGPAVAPHDAPLPGPRRRPSADEPEVGERPAGRRRRGRGRRRGGPNATEAGDRAPVASSTSEEPIRKLPPVWDDDYFFAALPTVPSLQAEDRDTDRYGAEAVAPPEEAQDPGDDATTTATRRKRRRRRRGRRPAGEGGGSPDAPPSDDPS